MAASAASMPEPQSPAFTRLHVQQQAAARTNQPTGENEAAFLAAVDSVFARWSLLRLAVEMGWGDGSGAANIQLLKQETLAWLQKRRASNVEPSDLEDLLADFVNDRFVWQHCFENVLVLSCLLMCDMVSVSIPVGCRC